MGFLENLCMGTGKQAVEPFGGNMGYYESDKPQEGGSRRKTRRVRRIARYDTRKQRKHTA